MADSLGPITLTEDKLFTLIKEMPPSLVRAQIALHLKESSKRSFSENFGAELSASASQLSSSEISLSAFAPVTSKMSSLKMGVAKKFRRGVAVELTAYKNQYTNTMLTDVTSTGLTMQLSIDLYKDLLGRLTKARWSSLVYDKQRSKLEERLATAGFIVQLRKLYWSLVANSEARKLVNSLIKASKRQVALAQRRLKERVADYGEVARYKSQLASRKAQLIYLNYKKERAVQVMKGLLPTIAQQKIVLGTYSLDETVYQFFGCINQIKDYKEVPLANTTYDEIITIINKQAVESDRIHRAHDLPDLKLQLAADTMGKALGGSEAFDQFKNNSRGSISGAISLTIPLGREKKNSQEILQLITKMSRDAAVKESRSKIDAYHTQIVASIDLLQQVISNQRDNSKYLSESIGVSRKKYIQARITVEQLVSKEDALLSSQLDEIETKLEVISTLLDYFSVFTETPCAMNRKQI
ncbi:MAG: TolC family protein [Bdellovibrionales bacterium]|nr:TolC family protein [Bdellovibrionales bacterium]MBT3525580.1 TolC family protein [Bdellovibrionales bacterium]MBT7768052.1 TolC family protein [Bdellovibrionales bacterium]